MDCIQGYIEGNITYSMQKAYALRIFSGCVLEENSEESLDTAVAFIFLSSEVILTRSVGPLFVL